MKKKNLDKVFLILHGSLKFFFVHSILIIAVVVGGYLVEDIFITRKEESLPLTYYGFAVFAALANICFSYSRILDDRESQFLLKSIGERFLFSAIGFLIGSLLNYICTNSVKLKIGVFTSKIFSILAGIFLLASFFYVSVAVHSLLNYLFDRTTLRKDNYFEEK